MVRWGFVLLILFAGCGIKAPPRPPLDEPPSSLVDVPDAGCCSEVKK
jgi:hypothetical protein